MTERNWAGNFAYRAAEIHRPTSLDALRELVARARSLRVLGSRHSFNAIADADELVSLRALEADIVTDGETVSFGAGLTYGELAVELQSRGLALHNLASLPHISVAGAIATATHGSGNANGNLATAVRALELVTSDGEVRRVQSGDADFDGAVVHLGALGVVTRLTLAVEPTFELRQRVFEGLSWEALAEHFDAITGAGYSVSIVTTLRLHRRLGVGEEPRRRHRALRRPPGDGRAPRDPRPGPGEHDAAARRPRPLVRAPAALPHGLPAVQRRGDPERVPVAARARPAGDRRAARPPRRCIRVLQVCEIRTVAADRFWMSPMYERDTVALHFTWVRDQAAVEAALAHLEPALAPFDPRPHWGKVFLAAPSYPRGEDFLALVERYDPRGLFRNDWFSAALGPRSGR